MTAELQLVLSDMADVTLCSPFYLVTNGDVLMSLPHGYCCRSACVSTIIILWHTHSWGYFISKRQSLFSTAHLCCSHHAVWHLHEALHTEKQPGTDTHTNTHTHTHTQNSAFGRCALLLPGISGCKWELKALWHTGCGRNRLDKNKAIF